MGKKKQQVVPAGHTCDRVQLQRAPKHDSSNGADKSREGYHCPTCTAVWFKETNLENGTKVIGWRKK